MVIIYSGSLSKMAWICRGEVLRFLCAFWRRETLSWVRERDALQPGPRTHRGADVAHLHAMERFIKWGGRRRRVCKDMLELLELLAIFRDPRLLMNKVTRNHIKHT